MSGREAFAREKYLRRHMPDALPGLEKFSRVVVLPAWNELEFLPETLDSLEQAEKPVPVAVLVVVNHPRGSDPAPSIAAAEFLRVRQQTDKSLFFLEAPDLDGGVGEARKRGMDAYLGARSVATAASDWIFSLDADAPVARDYFVRAEAAFRSIPDATGWTFPYRHRADPETLTAVRRYEEHLARYAAKLREARSPYAIHTIGSAFCVRLDHYLKADGMKIRPAGEDFYFLCELVKTGKVSEMDGEPVVFPSGRISGRTPFGTGRAVRGILAGDPPEEIPDEAFAELKALLETIEDPRFGEAPEEWFSALPEVARAFFAAEKFPPLWEKVLRNTPRNAEARRAAFHRWFDGLKTLRFLHFVRSMRGSAAI
ncbi:MAG: glycosyltransferase family 2 protein [Victivallaceae bacterium]|nr:glycosyltransferase family 2 protein [Victivallaceae bacterium]